MAPSRTNRDLPDPTKRRIALLPSDFKARQIMENAKLMSMLSRLFFFGALAFLGLAIVEKGLNLIGQTLPVLNVFPSTLL